jgi:Domain of unknown function (DUF4783)
MSQFLLTANIPALRGIWPGNQQFVDQPGSCRGSGRRLWADFSIFQNGIILARWWVLMKGRIAIFLLFGGLLMAVRPCQAQDNVIDQVRETIKAGSSRELARLIAETVDVSINSKVETYSKAQAEFVLRDFFK